MKGQHLKIALTVCIFAILALVWVNYVDLGKDGDDRLSINEGLTSLIEFDLDCQEVGTSTRGTFFVMQSEDSVKIKIVADLTVGETDIGGIEFGTFVYFDSLSVLCSYRGEVSREYLTIFSASYIGHRVEIARSRPYSDGIASGGGDGMAIIELQISGSSKLNSMDSLDFFITVGGSESVMGLAVERISIPLLHTLHNSE